MEKTSHHSLNHPETLQTHWTTQPHSQVWGGSYHPLSPWVTQGNFLTCPLGRQGKHVWSIVRQPPIKTGWWDAPLTLWDLAEICLNKARNTKDAFSAGPKQDLVPHATTTHPPTIKAFQTTKITKLGLLPLPTGF